MKKINVYLSDQQYATLLQMAKQTDVSMAEYIRRALDAWMKQQQPLTEEAIDAMSLPELFTLVRKVSTLFGDIAHDPRAKKD